MGSCQSLDRPKPRLQHVAPEPSPRSRAHPLSNAQENGLQPATGTQAQAMTPTQLTHSSAADPTMERTLTYKNKTLSAEPGSSLLLGSSSSGHGGGFAGIPLLHHGAAVCRIDWAETEGPVKVFHLCGKTVCFLHAIVTDVTEDTKLVSLKSMFDAFEVFAEKFSICRINTHGDVWRGVSGILSEGEGDTEAEPELARKVVAQAVEMSRHAQLLGKELKIGISTGIVYSRFDADGSVDAWGEASNNASLLACLAQRVEILMDDATQELLVQNMNLVMGKTELRFGDRKQWFYHLPCEKMPDGKPSPFPMSPGSSKEEDMLHGRVVLAEDNPTNQKLAKRMMERFGIEVFVADNGQEAIEVLKEKWPVDIILMDLEMPDLDGFEATQIIRYELEEPISSVPIVALTGFSSSDEARKYYEAGMDDFVTKPLRQAVLKEIIRKWVEISASRGKKRRPLTFADIPEILIGEISEVDSAITSKALICDPDDMSRKLLSRMLTRLKWDVTSCKECDRVISKLQEEWPFDSIFISVAQPMWDGWELARTIRTLKNPYRAIPIIALSRSANTQEYERIITGGMDDFITLPLALHSVRSVADRWKDSLSLHTNSVPPP